MAGPSSRSELTHGVDILTSVHHGQRADARPVAERRRGRPLADDERRLQALRRGPLPARVPTGAIIYNEFANVYIQPRHLQRLLVLHRGLPVRGHHPQRLRWPFAQVHALLRPPAGRPGPGLCQGLSDRSRSSSGRSTSCANGPGKRVKELHARGVTAAYLYGDEPTETYTELHSFYLLVDRPAVYGLPETPFNPWLHMLGDYGRTIVSALVTIAAILAVLLFRGRVTCRATTRCKRSSPAIRPRT